MNMNIDQKRKLCESAETLLEKIKETYFWAVLAIWNLCVLCKFGLDQKFWETCEGLSLIQSPFANWQCISNIQECSENKGESYWQI